MVTTKIRTLAKQLSRLTGRLQTYLALAAKIRRYVIQVVDLEEKIKYLQRVQRSFDGIEITDVEDDNFVVKSKENYYIVRPNHPDPKFRCDCADCYYRARKCKHQIAVERFVAQSFSLFSA